MQVRSTQRARLFFLTLVAGAAFVAAGAMAPSRADTPAGMSPAINAPVTAKSSTLQRLACTQEECHDSCDQFFPRGPKRESCFQACLRQRKGC